MIDKKITDQVLEALALDVQESSMSKEIGKINVQIHSLMVERERLEKAKSQAQQAQGSSIRTVEVAKEMAQAAVKAAKEAQEFADRALTAVRETQQFALIAAKGLNFDKPIEEANKALSLSQQSATSLTKKVAEIKTRRQELKQEGIYIDLSAEKKARITTL